MSGRLIFNGNARTEAEIIETAAPWLKPDARVLLVTAGWGEHEFSESHVKAALNQAGVRSNYRDGFDRALQNLGVYHAWRQFLADHTDLAAAWQERQELIAATRQAYLGKNAFYIQLLRTAFQQFKSRYPEWSLARMMGDAAHHFHHPPGRLDGRRLLGYFLARDIRDTVEQIKANDDRMMELLQEMDTTYVDSCGLTFYGPWQKRRDELAERILQAEVIFVFGGDLDSLYESLQFFRLRGALTEALRRGATIFTSSAGSLMMCERIIVFNDFESREFQLFDKGFGLVRHLQIFPHCMDRIQTDDADNLSYLAYRFNNRTCVGLNEDSYLLVELHDGTVQCRSVGHRDAVYVFDPSGGKLKYHRDQTVPIN